MFDECSGGFGGNACLGCQLCGGFFFLAGEFFFLALLNDNVDVPLDEALGETDVLCLASERETGVRNTVYFL